MMFNSPNVLAHINGSTSSDETKTADWNVVDRFTRGTIFQSITVDIRAEMHSMHSTQVMWDYLQGRF